MAHQLGALVCAFWWGLSLVVATPALAQMQVSVQTDRAEAYVNQQILLTLSVSAPLDAFGIGGDKLQIPGVRLQAVDRQQKRRRIADQPYLQTTTVYSLFASRPGTIQVPALTYSAKMPVPTLADGSRQSGGNPRVSASSKRFDIRIQPAPVDERVWFAASDVQIDARWLAADTHILAGQPFGYEIIVNADNQYAAAIPALQLSVAEPLRVYPAIPQLAETESIDGISGSVTQSYTLLAGRGGRFEIPSVSIDWWDTRARAWRVATLPARAVVIGPAAGGGRDWARWTLPLLVILALLSLVLAITATVLWRKLRRLQRVGRSPRRERSQWRALQWQLGSGSAAQIRHCTLAWASAWNPSIVRLDQLALADPALVGPLHKLDAVLYAHGDDNLLPADRKQLRMALKKLRNSGGSVNPAADLPPLYPHA